METIDGRTVRVARWSTGRSDRPPLLFFNGIGANIELVSPLAEKMPERDFITFDMPGVGGSPEPAIPYRPWMMARLADVLLDQFGYDQVDVMGISWGGGLAQQFAVQFGSRVNKLVLVATSAGMLMVPGNVTALSKMINPKRYLDPDYMLNNFKTLYGGVDSGAEAHAERITPPTRMGYFYQLVAMMGWTSAPWLPFLRTKTLIMMGDDDRIVPLINGKFLNSLIPNSRLEVIKGGGHLFLMAEADLCIRLINGFLDEPTGIDRKAA